MSDKRKLRSRKVSERMAVVDEADRRRVRLPPHRTMLPALQCLPCNASL